MNSETSSFESWWISDARWRWDWFCILGIQSARWRFDVELVRFVIFRVWTARWIGIWNFCSYKKDFPDSNVIKKIPNSHNWKFEVRTSREPINRETVGKTSFLSSSRRNLRRQFLRPRDVDTVKVTNYCFFRAWPALIVRERRPETLVRVVGK